MNELRRQGGVTPAVEPRLWRSRTKKVFAGVVGGLAEKFKIDVALMRVLYSLFTFFSGIFPGMFVYFLLWYVMPERDD
jgi:phage shock protein C